MTFNKFLMQQYIEEEHPLDDDMADGFGDWYSNQDIEEICKYAEEWKYKEMKENKEI